MDVLVAARGGEVLDAQVTGPLGAPVIARFALLPDRATAIVEMAQASGLGLVAADQRDAERASTFGTGELILAARDVGARSIVVTVGGSATTDGGLGAIDAIERGGGLGGASLTVLCDVTTPYELAASVFGPQKGADPDAVKRLTARLNDAAEQLPRDPRGELWTGCAGGLSGGLWAAFDAQLVPGAGAVLDAVGFDERLENADAVATGEGRIDAQSLDGKITGEIVQRCARAGVPVHAIVGRNGLVPELAGLGLGSVTEAGTLEAIERAAAELVGRLEARTG
jgi:glycerate kinase